MRGCWLSLLLQGLSQWSYNDWLAEAAGADVAKLPAWRPAMYAANRQNKLSHPEDYRDRWGPLYMEVHSAWLHDHAKSCPGHHGFFGMRPAALSSGLHAVLRCACAVV